ncbi:hypothetical protein WJX77_001663 [Trebouxia sp. C0004]
MAPSLLQGTCAQAFAAMSKVSQTSLSSVSLRIVAASSAWILTTFDLDKWSAKILATFSMTGGRYKNCFLLRQTYTLYA